MIMYGGVLAICCHVGRWGYRKGFAIRTGRGSCSTRNILRNIRVASTANESLKRGPPNIPLSSRTWLKKEYENDEVATSENDEEWKDLQRFNEKMDPIKKAKLLNLENQ